MRWLKLILVLVFLSVPGYFIQGWYNHLEINPSLLVLIVIVFAKAASIIYPPLPGIILTVAMVPVLGWKKAYVIEVTGSLLGVTAAYWLGYRYGEKIIQWIAGEGLLKKIKAVKLKSGNQFEAAFVLRTASGGVLSDALAWGASLVGLRYWPYLLGHLTNHVLATLPIFLLVGWSVKVNSWLLIGPVMGLAWFLVWKFKGRYFE